MSNFALIAFAVNALVMAKGTETGETLLQAQRLDMSVEELEAHAKLLDISIEEMRQMTVVKIDETELMRRVAEFKELEQRRIAKLNWDLRLAELVVLQFRPNPRVVPLYVHGRSTAYMSLGLFRLWPGR